MESDISLFQMQKKRILESNKKARRGTASCVLQFTQFLLFSESLMKNARRSSLGKIIFFSVNSNGDKLVW